MGEEIKNKANKAENVNKPDNANKAEDVSMADNASKADNAKEELKQQDDTVKEYVERKRWLFFGLPFTFTKYTINEEIITIDTGLFNTVENDCYLYKVQDVELTTSLMERIFGLGTVACYTGDNTHPQLYLEHIKHAKEIKNYILKASEKARRKRRTLNTLNIDAADIADLEEL